MRISRKVDYALRAMIELAGAGHTQRAVTGESIAQAQAIPLRFLLSILNDLRRANLVVSWRGYEGGYALARPASEISLADVMRAIEGPLAQLHGESLTTIEYPGRAAPLRDVWMAVRGALRSVLDATTLADVASGRLPEPVRALTDLYLHERRH